MRLNAEPPKQQRERRSAEPPKQPLVTPHGCALSQSRKLNNEETTRTMTWVLSRSVLMMMMMMMILRHHQAPP